MAVHDDIIQNLKVQLSIESKSPQDQREIGLAFVKLKAQGYKVALLSELFELSQPDLFRYYVLGRVPLTVYEAYLRSDITYTALISFGAIHRYAPNALPKLLDKYVQGEVSLIEIQSHARWLRSEWMVAKRKKGGYSTRAGRLE